jgi:hypothetical protein
MATRETNDASTIQAAAHTNGDTANGHSSVAVTRVEELLQTIRTTTDQARALLAYANPETLKLFADALSVQRDGLTPSTITYLTNPSLVGTPQREVFAPQWVAWAEVHLNTLRSVVILATSAATAASSHPPEAVAN